ncbi:TPA: AAA family ATPase [Stenotrophomonas maltophilia]|nr:AAA family ATPase [Stenotrophomonas maltophilia]
MHLDSLTLIGVRQFKRQTFYFRPGFNLLVGENGAGKTTILRGLLAAMASSRQRGSSFNLQDSDIGFGARRAEVSAVVRSGNEFKEFSFYKELWKPAERTKDRKSAPLVLLYSSSESICSALKAKRGRLVRELVNDPSRGSEEFLYAAEERVRQRTAVDRSKKFGNSRSVRDFVGKVLSTFSPAWVTSTGALNPMTVHL